MMISADYDQKTFELSILCGNLIIIIDGLDEFVSIFQEQFDTNEFQRKLSWCKHHLKKTKPL